MLLSIKYSDINQVYKGGISKYCGEGRGLKSAAHESIAREVVRSQFTPDYVRNYITGGQKHRTKMKNSV